LIHPSHIKTKGGARPGDVLLLTKPLGVGVVTTALKRQMASEADVAAATDSMKQLNRQAAQAALAVGASAMTDITGFGLLGHASEMSRAGAVDFRFFVNQLRWLPGALRYGEAGAFPGGMHNNFQHFAQWVTFQPEVPTLVQDMVYTPETSGGLLVALSPDQVMAFQQQCAGAFVVGEVAAGDGRIWVEP
jgi:selenide,water dikinase